MMRVTFSGYSDDKVQCILYGSCETHSYIVPARSFDLISQDGRVRVHAIFDRCWSFAVGLVEKGDGLPDWPIRVSAGETGYTTEIKAPADVELRREISPS